MGQKSKSKYLILIADDSEMNRSILADMLGEEYEIIEAENGVEAVSEIQKRGVEISLILLDIVMPEMDGFGVLEIMNEHKWIEDIPVIMISSESASAYVERAYDLGVTDFIGRPFDAIIVRRRVVNTILLYAKQKKLIGLVADQIYEKQKQNNLMIDILSHIVEFRNCESGLHVRNVHICTELLLNRLVQKTDKYKLSQMDISIISTASALHDVGKIAIDEKVLNKPGKFTDEEYAIMQTHTTIGAQMIKDLPIHQNEPLVEIAYEICRWHHERYDGRGYPDGLVGDEIPVSAQIVALADVYDALTSERVYKKAIDHEKAVEMIVDGQCGIFNPQILECLTDIADKLREAVNSDNPKDVNKREIKGITEEMMRYGELNASVRTLQLLEHERMKYSFFAAMTQEIQFEYIISPAMITISAWGVNKLGLEEIIMNPIQDKRVLQLISRSDWIDFVGALQKTTPEDPMITYECMINYKGNMRWSQIIARTTWTDDEPPECISVIGKAIDIHDSHEKLNNLERMATHDSLTGLVNRANAEKKITERMEMYPEKKYALAIIDMDYFKSANDTYGHIFGDRVLMTLADKLRQSVRSNDIAARIGGDEFMLFLEYNSALEPIIKRIFSSLSGKCDDFVISVSMGVAESDFVGCDYDALFHAADQALYSVKRSGRGQFKFYDDTMQQMFSDMSVIDELNNRDENVRKGEQK